MGKHLKYVITPITVQHCWIISLKYVITPNTQPIFLETSEIRDYANHGANFIGETSEIRDYANHRPKNVDNNLKYVITGSLKKN